MFKIKEVEVTNFRSFIGTHKWVLHERPGLYYLTGRNDENPRLGKNGIGKSSLLDAISWCDYGKTTRGIRGPDVISRGYNTCSVSVRHVVGDEEFTVTTTQNPNSIKIDNQIVDRETLVKKLRLNYESFLYSIIIPQAGNSFLDLSPGEKLTLFSQIMDLDFWLDKSKEADNKATEIDNKRKLIESNVINLNGSIITIESSIEELRFKSKDFDRKKDEKIDQLAENQAKTSIEIRNLGNQISEIEHSIALLIPEFQSAEVLVKAQEKVLKKLDLELSEVEKEVAITEHKLLTFKNTEQRFEKVGAVCPTCNQKVDKSHLAKELEKLKQTAKVLKAEKSAFLLAKDDINSDRSKVNTKLSNHEAALTSLRSKETRLKGDKLALNNEIIYLQRENTRLGLEIKNTKGLKNEFAQMLSSKNNELISLKKTVEDKNIEIAKLNEEHAAVYFWVAGFKRLRLHIIQETLRSLEIEVNNNLVALGLGDWKVEFDIERENKAGGITKGFITLITDPKGYTAPYSTMSFGETQRIKLAGSFGLANLIIERAGLSTKIQFYDEPCVHMTLPDGVIDTLNALRDMAISTEREVFVIEHSATEYSDFNGTVHIIRDENGSRIEVQRC